MLHLPDVTLVVIDTAYHQLTEMAVNDTLSHVSFEDILVFSDRPLDVPAATIPCQITSMEDVQQFMWYGVYPRLQTNLALYIQWDGWVTSPEFWQEDFRQFDWIGALWPWHPPGKRVGNGGFSLRSRKLLEILNAQRTKFPLAPVAGQTVYYEDQLVCLHYSDQLAAEYGIKFADETTASAFSTEHDANPSAFGFHGIWNWLDRLSDQECIARLNLFTESQLNRESMFLLLNRAHSRPELLPVIQQLFRRYHHA
jgi:hypothetical protein